MTAPAIYKLSLATWVKATFIGWFLGFIFLLVLATIFGVLGIEHLQFFMGVGMGAGVGLMQWRVLKRTHNISTSWLWWQVTGLGTCFLITDIIKLTTHQHSISHYNLPISIITGSIASGYLQFRILRKISDKANLWIIASFLSWTCSLFTALSIDFTKYISHSNLVLFCVNIFLILAGGVVLGLISGVFLKKIISGNEIPA